MTTDEDIIGTVLGDEVGHDPRNPTGMVDREGDHGGVTQWGITCRGYTPYLQSVTGNLKAVATPEDIRALSEANAREFYRWLLKSTRIASIPNPEVRYFVFDAAVLMGERPGIRLLQRALGIHDDGIIGGVTVAAVPFLNAEKLCRLVGIEQMLMQHKIVRGDLTDADKDGIPDQLENLEGWGERLARKMRRYA